MPLAFLFGLALLLACPAAAQPAHEITVSGTSFLLNGKPFAYTGVSFFNAIYNPSFNRSSEERRQWMRKFQGYGIRVFRLWGQWDNRRGFVDSCPECSLYLQDGSLRENHLQTLQAICADADALGIVIELALFSRESWNEEIRLDNPAADKAVAALTRALLSYRNVVFQIWNEHDHRTLDHYKTIKSIDARRLVTNSPGYAGVLDGAGRHNDVLDFLTPHTSRQSAGRHWEIAPKEIEYLLARFRKPVVDDEPARNGTRQFGGPAGQTDPYDHILQIYSVWRIGGHVIYHHDMFQTGAGSAAVPPSGIPDPEFNPYHRAVFEFLAKQERYLNPRN
jgi:hypothetical protein